MESPVDMAWKHAIVGAGLSRDPHSYGGASRAASEGSIGFQPVFYGSDTGKMPVLLFFRWSLGDRPLPWMKRTNATVGAGLARDFWSHRGIKPLLQRLAHFGGLSQSSLPGVLL